MKGKPPEKAPHLIWPFGVVAFVVVFVGHVLYLRYLTIAPQRPRLFCKLLLCIECRLCGLGCCTFYILSATGGGARGIWRR